MNNDRPDNNDKPDIFGESEWLPIETAPHDGTVIEFLGENGNLDVGFWDRGEFTTTYGEGPFASWRQSKWLPIETAPHDGTVIELLGGNGNLDIGLWEYGGFSARHGEWPFVFWRQPNKCK